MNKWSRGLRVAVAGFSVAVCCLPVSVGAQGNEGFHITTSPLPIRLVTEPGKTVTTELRVKNTGTATERIKVGLMKFGASGDLGRPDLKDREPGDDYFDWVKFSPQVLDAPPDQWREVKMTVTVPKTAGLGYYYAVTFSRATNQTGKDKTAVIGSTATMVLLDVTSANAKRSLELSSFSSDRKMYEFLPSRFDIKVRNTGNIHLVPVGSMFITRGKHKIATIDINTAQGNVLPQSNRLFTMAWDDGFPVYKDTLADDKPVIGKDGKAVRGLTWDFARASRLRFGKYTAKLVMAYNDGKRDVPLEATVSFWVIPWRILGVGLLVALFVGIGLWSTGRNVMRRVKKIAKKPEA